jgi:ABC-type microcin C transport system duplicated ATPase subunit YejF
VVETGTATRVVSDPHDSYTRRLIASAPSVAQVLAAGAAR